MVLASRQKASLVPLARRRQNLVICFEGAGPRLITDVEGSRFRIDVGLSRQISASCATLIYIITKEKWSNAV